MFNECYAEFYTSMLSDDPDVYTMMEEYEDNDEDIEEFEDENDRKERLNKIKWAAGLALVAIAVIRLVKMKVKNSQKKKLFKINSEKLITALREERNQLLEDKKRYIDMSKDRKNYSRSQRKEYKDLVAKIDNQITSISHTHDHVISVAQHYCTANELNLVNASNKAMRDTLRFNPNSTSFSKMGLYQDWKHYKTDKKMRKKKEKEMRKRMQQESED